MTRIGLQERLLSVIRSFPERRIVIVGDAIADKFGSELRAKLEAAGVDINGVIISEKVQTITKVRILAGHSHSSKQQVIRIDYDSAPINDAALRETLINRLERTIADADAVVISDYNYGVVEAQTIEAIRKINVPVLVDSRFRLSEFTGFTAATPNQEEVENLISSQISSVEQLETVASELKHRLGYRALLVTRGRQGMTLLEGDTTPLHIPAVGAQQAVDVTGAGDTVIATFALALACGASFVDAAQLANYAGGLVVMKRGTATVSAAELEQAIRQD